MLFLRLNDSATSGLDGNIAKSDKHRYFNVSIGPISPIAFVIRIFAKSNADRSKSDISIQ